MPIVTHRITRFEKKFTFHYQYYSIVNDTFFPVLQISVSQTTLLMEFILKLSSCFKSKNSPIINTNITGRYSFFEFNDNNIRYENCQRNILLA